MATTIVDPPRPIKKDLDGQVLLDDIHDQLERAQGDEDKAGSVDDSCYYEGWVNALTWVQDLMTEDKKG